MMDLFYVVGIAALIALTVALVAACDKLGARK
jgi:hypothetical protein